MNEKIFIPEEGVTCMHCITGEWEQLYFQDNKITSRTVPEKPPAAVSFFGPGLIDLQINGVNGIDFNNPALTVRDVVNATHFLLTQGVTTFFPTVITNADETVCKLLQTIHQACVSDSLVDSCIYGIHLEGPFISPLPGARGAHDAQYVKAPDWALFQEFQQAAGGRIKLVTLSPEWDEAPSFIERCREQEILVSIGHSVAEASAINLAVKAGATMSTHLGNGVPLVLPRHPNIIWEQLAAPGLYACIIADGIHIPDSFIRVVVKIKAEKTIVVSDATCFAGMEPGEYENHIGGTIVLDQDKRVSLKNTPGMLAGAAKTLLENVETLVGHSLFSLGEAWKMASVNAATVLFENDGAFDQHDDLVIFDAVENKIQVKGVIKGGRIVFKPGPV